MNHINEYIEKNKDRFLEELFELIRIPSISSMSEHKQDMYKCAEKWAELILKSGGDKAEVFETEGHPILYAEKIIDKNLPTVLVYAHYDVMPVDPIDKWNTEPFEPVIKDGKIWARGADDDKGQGYMHTKAFELMIKTDTLPCNVKFMIEGEEEIGSPSLVNWCKKHKDMLEADVILVSDTGMLGMDNPSITTGLRGICYWQVDVTGPNRDLHSGLYGGAVANPINVLCELITKLQDKDGKVTVPGFYDDVLKVSEKERELLNKAPFNEQAYKDEIGVKALKGEKGFTTMERTGIRPSFDVCGIYGGYTGEGAKTVLPSTAHAKISTRLVPNQNYKKIAGQFKEYFQSLVPDYITVNVRHLHGGQAYVCPIELPAYIAAEKAFKDTFGKTPVPVRSGGSIPIISTFEEVLGYKSVLMGFGLASDAIHSPNENYPVENFFKGIQTIPLFYKYFVEQYNNNK